jgi:hypothetical protein
MNQPSTLLQNRLRSYRSLILLGLIVTGFGTFIAGCGLVGGVKQLAAIILTQPANQFSRVGQTASFTVTARGTAPLTYQWIENGTAIPGATSAVYNTPILAPGNNGSTFSVTVTNAVNSVSSNSVSLTVGPRTPQVGDLRFQQVDALSTSSGLAAGGAHSDVSGGLAQNFINSIGTPFRMGNICVSGKDPLTCSWFFVTFPLPTGLSGLTINYQSSTNFDNLDSDLNALAVQDTVITSLDLEPNNDAFAISSIQTSQAGGFSFIRHSVPPAQVQALATQLGEQSQVITAISFDTCADAFFLSYGWQSDTTTIYESKVVTATLSTVGAEATNLALAGYIITALGGDTTNGFLLVGTRVQGDTMPRPILVVVPTTDADLTPLFLSGNAVVGYLVNAGTSTWIAEQ